MNSWIEKPKLKIILLGDSGVGKTSLLKRYEGKEFKQLLYNSTISVDVITKELRIEEKSVILQIWDTAGQERFKSVPSWFYRDTDCCVLVYDVNILKTFDSLNNWHDEFIKQANPMTPNKFPFVLMGNKIDIKNGNPRVVAKEMADQWCDSKGNIAYFETSAKENTNVDEAFLEMAKKALSNENWIDDIYRNGTVTKVGQLTKVENLTKVEKQPRRCSC